MWSKLNQGKKQIRQSDGTVRRFSDNMKCILNEVHLILDFVWYHEFNNHLSNFQIISGIEASAYNDLGTYHNQEDSKSLRSVGK